ncbi:phage tail tape measure protein [Paenibacillus larvae]|nr:phage tail tape measure protein [Paenibacillus larvae]MDT2304978.1 phage tail tape measure protein [Paenibacillus larvae]
MAGQAFASSLTRLAKPTAEMEKVMKATGISFFDAQGKMKSMPDLIAEIEKGTRGMTDQQKSATLSAIWRRSLQTLGYLAW